MKMQLLAGLMAGVIYLGGAAQPRAQDFTTMPLSELVETAPRQHPAALYVLAARLMEAGHEQEAAGWMYAGQIRYRFLLKVSDAGGAGSDATVFTALSEQVGRPVNEYIAGNADEWIAAMDWALAWDAANDNAVTSKTEHADALAEVRQGLVGLRQQVDEGRDDIARQRRENGLQNR